MAAIVEEIDRKLRDLLDIANRPVTAGADIDKLDLVATLLFLYDSSWQLPRSRMLFGQKTLCGDTTRCYKPAEIKTLKRWLHVAGLGHLVAEESANLTELRRYPRTITALLDRLDQVHGAPVLKLKVRNYKLSKKKQVSEQEPSESQKEVQVQDQERIPLHEVQENGRIIPTGKQLPRTPPQVTVELVERNDVPGRRGSSPGSQRTSSFYSPVITSGEHPGRRLTSCSSLRAAVLEASSSNSISANNSNLHSASLGSIGTASLPSFLNSPSPLPQRRRQNRKPRTPVTSADFDISGLSDLVAETKPNIIPTGKQLSRTPHSSVPSDASVSSQADRATDSPDVGTATPDLPPYPTLSGSYSNLPTPDLPPFPTPNGGGAAVDCNMSFSDLPPPPPTPPHVTEAIMEESKKRGNSDSLPVGEARQELLKVHHVIPTGNQIPNTPLLTLPDRKPSTTEPSGVYELPADLEAIAIPTQLELQELELKRRQRPAQASGVDGVTELAKLEKKRSKEGCQRTDEPGKKSRKETAAAKGQMSADPSVKKGGADCGRQAVAVVATALEPRGQLKAEKSKVWETPPQQPSLSNLTPSFARPRPPRSRKLVEAVAAEVTNTCDADASARPDAVAAQGDAMVKVEGCETAMGGSCDAKAVPVANIKHVAAARRAVAANIRPSPQESQEEEDDVFLSPQCEKANQIATEYKQQQVSEDDQKPAHQMDQKKRKAMNGEENQAMGNQVDKAVTQKSADNTVPLKQGQSDKVYRKGVAVRPLPQQREDREKVKDKPSPTEGSSHQKLVAPEKPAGQQATQQQMNLVAELSLKLQQRAQKIRTREVEPVKGMDAGTENEGGESEEQLLLNNKPSLPCPEEPETGQGTEKRQQLQKPEKKQQDAGKKQVTGKNQQETEKKKQETESKKQETERIKQETERKNQETERKKQETERKKQETESKKQENESKKQETESKKQETGSKKQDTGSKKQETESKKQEPESKKQETERIKQQAEKEHQDSQKRLQKSENLQKEPGKKEKSENKPPARRKIPSGLEKKQQEPEKVQQQTEKKQLEERNRLKLAAGEKQRNGPVGQRRREVRPPKKLLPQPLELTASSGEASSPILPLRRERGKSTPLYPIPDLADIFTPPPATCQSQPSSLTAAVDKLSEKDSDSLQVDLPPKPVPTRGSARRGRGALAAAKQKAGRNSARRSAATAEVQQEGSRHDACMKREPDSTVQKKRESRRQAADRNSILADGAANPAEKSQEQPAPSSPAAGEEEDQHGRTHDGGTPRPLDVPEMHDDKGRPSRPEVASVEDSSLMRKLKERRRKIEEGVVGDPPATIRKRRKAAEPEPEKLSSLQKQLKKRRAKIEGSTEVKEDSTRKDNSPVLESQHGKAGSAESTPGQEPLRRRPARGARTRFNDLAGLCSSTENTPSPGPHGRANRQRTTGAQEAKAVLEKKAALVAKYFDRNRQLAAEDQENHTEKPRSSNGEKVGRSSTPEESSSSSSGEKRKREEKSEQRNKRVKPSEARREAVNSLKDKRPTKRRTEDKTVSPAEDTEVTKETASSSLKEKRRIKGQVEARVSLPPEDKEAANKRLAVPATGSPKLMMSTEPTAAVRCGSSGQARGKGRPRSAAVPVRTSRRQATTPGGAASQETNEPSPRESSVKKRRTRKK